MKVPPLVDELDRWNSATERRHGPRAEMSGRVQGHFLPANLPVTVLNMGSGGFSIRTSEPVIVGDRREFRFLPNDGAPLTIAARVIYSLRAHGDDGATFYYTGLQFVADVAPEAAAALERLLVVMRESPTRDRP